MKVFVVSLLFFGNAFKTLNSLSCKARCLAFPDPAASPCTAGVEESTNGVALSRHATSTTAICWFLRLQRALGAAVLWMEPRGGSAGAAAHPPASARARAASPRRVHTEPGCQRAGIPDELARRQPERRLLVPSAAQRSRNRAAVSTRRLGTEGRQKARQMKALK